jgi:hypothetical protein
VYVNGPECTCNLDQIMRSFCLWWSHE